MLLYGIDTPPDAEGELVYTITLNDERGIGGAVGDVGWSSHAVVPKGALRRGTKANNIAFKLVRGEGRLSFNDIVLWFQRDV